ncbi:hypothetical protein DFS34DRAFT_647642 [Phlyctochytrium arcticum]|nr:hypothetical protein DFS34DRAFT_647642 [Phlyctochytrium arcticum]
MIERASGVLQIRWEILTKPAKSWYVKSILGNIQTIKSYQAFLKNLTKEESKLYLRNLRDLKKDATSERIEADIVHGDAAVESTGAALSAGVDNRYTSENAGQKRPRREPLSDEEDSTTDCDRSDGEETPIRILDLLDIPKNFNLWEPASFLLQNGVNVAKKFYNYQRCALALARQKSLCLETNVHEILALSSVLLITPQQHSPLLLKHIVIKELDQVMELAKEFAGFTPYEMPDELEVFLRRVSKMARGPKSKKEIRVNLHFSSIKRKEGRNAEVERSEPMLWWSGVVYSSVNVLSDPAQKTRVTQLYDLSLIDPALEATLHSPTQYKYLRLDQIGEDHDQEYFEVDLIFRKTNQDDISAGRLYKVYSLDDVSEEKDVEAFEHFDWSEDERGRDTDRYSSRKLFVMEVEYLNGLNRFNSKYHGLPDANLKPVPGTTYKPIRDLITEIRACRRNADREKSKTDEIVKRLRVERGGRPVSNTGVWQF